MRNVFLIFTAILFISIGFARQNSNSDGKTLTEGMKAPDFTLQDAYGKSYTLSSYKGKAPVIVYFYPKANTAGCTKQACGIRDEWSKFEKNNIKVFGISTDSKDDIMDFIKNNNLNFPLLSDKSQKVSKDYGVLNDNGMDKRVTFIVDKKGKISKVVTVTDIEKHANEVFELALKLK
jgi:thioredoxin-dependent peroxiredoxin